MPKFHKKQVALLGFLVLVVLGIQLSTIQRPFVGHYASYQGTVMAAMARNMVRENFREILLPKTDAVIGGERSLHLNQYPFPSLLAALGVRFVGGSYEFWGRFQAVCFNLFSLILLILIARRLFDPMTALVAGCLYAWSPYTLIYGQSFMSEASSLCFLLLALWSLLKNSSFVGVTLSALFFSIAVTGRVHWALLWPVFGFSLWREPPGIRFKKMILFTIIASILPVAWYAHTYFVSLGATNLHTNLFLQASAQKSDQFWLFSNPIFFIKTVRIFFGMMLTPLLAPFFFAGLILGDRKSHSFKVTAIGILAAVLVAFLAPLKVITHDFYLYAATPFFIMMASVGLARIRERFRFLAKSLSIGIFLALYGVVSFRFFSHPIFVYPENEIQAAERAQIVKKTSEKGALVIAAGENAPILAYYVDRPSWQFQPSQIGGALEDYQRVEGLSGNDLNELRELEAAQRDGISWVEYLKDRGATYFFAPHKEEIDRVPNLSEHLRSHYQNLAKDEDGYYFYRMGPTPA